MNAPAPKKANRQLLQSDITMKSTILLLILSLAVCWSPKAQAVDHNIWNVLLQKHVQVINSGNGTQVDYAGIAKEQEILQQYLQQMSSIPVTEFDNWPKTKQLAFLINAYNAWTVSLILTKYPALSTIKDLGSFFQTPWKKKFIPLLGEERSLDDIEHNLIRGSGRYNDPRIHFAVNCASIGCPALRAEAYRGEHLENQLEDAARNFLQDHQRNRYENATLKISSLFKWYKKDFAQGWRGAKTLDQFLALYHDSLQIPANQLARLKNGDINIVYLEYDWHLNDT